MPPGWIVVWLWQFWATAFCLMGALLLWPVSVYEEWVGAEKEPERELKRR